MVDFRYIGWAEYGSLVEKLTEKVRAGGADFDLVVGIARGGIPVAMVLSDRLDVKVDIINVKSYTGIAKRSRPKIVSTLTEGIRGKRVLVVDDLVDHGDTMKTVVGYLLRMKPKTLRTAVLFKKPWSKNEPDYYTEVVDEWIVFPWELGEVERLRMKQSL